MSDQQSPGQGELLTELQVALRDAVVAALDDVGLESSTDFAAALGIAASSAGAMLRRQRWSIEDALWVIEKLRLPLEVEVRSVSAA